MTEDWTAAAFEDCLDRISYPNKVQRKDFQVSGRFPVISQESDFINGYWDDERDVLRVDRPIVVFGDHTQVLKYVDFDFVLGADGVKLLKPKASIDPKFFYYFLTAHRIEGVGYARHYRFLKTLIVRYPSLPEQQRIVAILDEAFAGLATATADAERNLKNALELFRSVLNSIFTRGKWPKKPLRALCDIFDDGDWIETKDQSPRGIRLIQTGNIGEGHFKDRGEKARYVSEATFKRLRCTEIFEGDCLISRLPDPVGRACLLLASQHRMITAVDCTIVRFRKELVVPEFFVFYTQSRAYAAAIEKQTTGATRQRISRKNLGDVPIPLPPVSEQRTVVEKLSGLKDEIQRLEVLYKGRLSQIQKLKQSILQKAFSGELTSPPLQAIQEAAE